MTRLRKQRFAATAHIPSAIGFKEQHRLDREFDLAQVSAGKLCVEPEMTPLALVAERARERLPGADVLLKAVAPVGGRRKLLVVFARVQSGFRAVDGLDTGRSGFVSEFVQRFQ